LGVCPNEAANKITSLVHELGVPKALIMNTMQQTKAMPYYSVLETSSITARFRWET
jgi:hypothetical protein